MLHEILTAEMCAKCKGCCFFDSDDAWEAPAKLIKSGEYMTCIHLMDDGCRLNQYKPIQCVMYPFRVMSLGQNRVIALCRYCEAVMELPLSHIVQFTDAKSEEFASLADKHPEIVKKYDREYIILKVL